VKVRNSRGVGMGEADERDGEGKHELDPIPLRRRDG
jgi:hypothetical protein